MRILSRASGSLTPTVMFIGEAPGRLGADDTRIPFHGDMTGYNFERLLDFAGIRRHDIYVTNAVLCNPRDERGNNATPSEQEVKNCSTFLKAQVDLINPPIIVTLGASALRALAKIEPHDCELRKSVRTVNSWYGRKLIPLYHPGQRAMLHRNFMNQRSDYHFLVSQVKKLDAPHRRIAGKTKGGIGQLSQAIFLACDNISYFALHKVAYLVECGYFEKFGQRLTDGYYIRQVDGPYCTDLNIRNIRGAYRLSVIKKDGRLMLVSKKSLFANCERQDPFVYELIDKYVAMTDAQLKKFAYLSLPMRKIIRQEKKTGVDLYNSPIFFERKSDSPLRSNISKGR